MSHVRCTYITAGFLNGKHTATRVWLRWINSDLLSLTLGVDGGCTSFGVCRVHCNCLLNKWLLRGQPRIWGPTSSRETPSGVRPIVLERLRPYSVSILCHRPEALTILNWLLTRGILIICVREFTLIGAAAEQLAANLILTFVTALSDCIFDFIQIRLEEKAYAAPGARRRACRLYHALSRQEPTSRLRARTSA